MSPTRVVIHRPGGHEQLRMEPFTVRTAGPGEVQIEVHAAGVNFADCIVRMGPYESAKHYVGWPITPGFEVAGRVLAIGPGVTTFREGDEVIAVSRFDGYATHLTVPAVQVFARPATLTVAQAAAFPAVHLTAWWAMHELAHPRPGGTLLVHSAAGGVGQALCGLGRIAGCRVVGVVGHASKLDAARNAGAQEVLTAGPDLRTRLAAVAPKGFDAVFDASGPETLRLSWDLLAPGGKLVVYGFHTMFRRGAQRPSWPRLVWGWLRLPRFNPVDMTGANKSLLAFNLSYLFDRTDFLTEAMTQLLAWQADGRLPAPPVTTFALDRVADAHRALESGMTTGKLVLLMAPGRP